jgi:hypothetical protein
MKTDPRIACANEREAFWWAALHDFVAHPFMVITFYSAWSLRFHDWTSHHAWPRPEIVRGETSIAATKFGLLKVTHLGGKVYSIDHPNCHHTVVLQADAPDEAADKAVEWFDSLFSEFGGKWAPDHHAAAEKFFGGKW